MQASWNGHIDIVKTLLEHGADANQAAVRYLGGVGFRRGDLLSFDGNRLGFVARVHARVLQCLRSVGFYLGCLLCGHRITWLAR